MAGLIVVPLSSTLLWGAVDCQEERRMLDGSLHSIEGIIPHRRYNSHHSPVASFPVHDLQHSQNLQQRRMRLDLDWVGGSFCPSIQ